VKGVGGGKGEGGRVVAASGYHLQNSVHAPAGGRGSGLAGRLGRTHGTAGERGCGARAVSPPPARYLTHSTWRTGEKAARSGGIVPKNGRGIGRRRKGTEWLLLRVITRVSVRQRSQNGRGEGGWGRERGG
jgi:hypothetical protein